jgi:cardiolipin synthase
MRYRPSWRRIVLWLSGALIAAQSLIIAALVAIAQIRKRRARPPDFPHERRLVSEVDGNEIRIYTYGQDLYNAMLAAIDDARETIFFETFIWKGDSVGKTFKDRLARKAAAGVKVFVIYGVPCACTSEIGVKSRPPCSGAGGG